jgi:hypothetical protein
MMQLPDVAYAFAASEITQGLLADNNITTTLANKLNVEAPSGAVGEPLPEVTP